jgi:hypothetical protein
MNLSCAENRKRLRFVKRKIERERGENFFNQEEAWLGKHEIEREKETSAKAKNYNFAIVWKKLERNALSKGLQ